MLLRSDCIRERNCLYEESGNVHVGQDVQVCLELLKDADFGFIHQILTFSRAHEDSLTSRTLHLSTIYPETLHLLKRYGPVYLTASEFQSCWKHILSVYTSFLGRSVFLSRGRDFWQYHRQEMRKLGYTLTPFDLGRNAFTEVLRAAWSPVRRVWYKRSQSKVQVADKAQPLSPFEI